MKIVCIGHGTYDITLPVDNYPIENYKYRINKKIECGGGSAANCAYLLAKWGLNVYFVGIIGNDYYGQNVIKEFNSIGVNTEYIEKSSSVETDSSYILSNLENGSRTIITSKTSKNANLLETVNILDADYILVDGEHYETAKDVLVKNKNAVSILDAGRFSDEVIELGKMVDYLICSKEFAESFSMTNIDVNNINSLIEVYDSLKSYFKNNVIITLEEAGSFTKTNEYKLIPSIKVRPIDSTGAGDIFHGAFIYFISKNIDLEKAIYLSSITAAISTTRIGSRYSIPDLDEVRERFEEIEVI